MSEETITIPRKQFVKLASEIESHKSSRRMWKDQCAGWASKASEWAAEKDALTAELAAARKDRDEAIAQVEKAENENSDLVVALTDCLCRAGELHTYLARKDAALAEAEKALEDLRISYVTNIVNDGWPESAAEDMPKAKQSAQALAAIRAALKDRQP